MKHFNQHEFNQRVDRLFEAIDSYADARAAVKRADQQLGSIDPDLLGFYEPEVCNERDQARAEVVRELAWFIRAVVAGEIS